MEVNCREYSKSMELLSLKKQMGNGIVDPKKQMEIEKRIRVLEKELDLE